MIVFNWTIGLTVFGAVIRRFHDMNMSGWYIVVLGITGVVGYWFDWVEKYPLADDPFDIIPWWDIIAIVIFIAGIVLWLYLLFKKGKEIGMTRWG